MADPFDSAWLKWAWGVADAPVLEDSIATLALQPDLQVYMPTAQHYDAKRHCIIWTVLDFRNPFPDFWGLLLGDVVHNWRSALDHIAWALYKRGSAKNLTPEEEGRIYFPTARYRTQFNKSLATRLPGVRRGDRAIVRRYQPYHGGKRRRDKHVLFVLNELSRLDKHRSLQPVDAFPATASYEIGHCTDCIYRGLAPLVWKGGILKPGTELVRFYVKKTGPEPDIEVQPHLTFRPALNENLALHEWLRSTGRTIGQLLREFAKPPAAAKRILENTPEPPPPEWPSPLTG